MMIRLVGPMDVEDLETCTLEEIKDCIEHERETGFQHGNRYRIYDLVPPFNLADWHIQVC